MPRDQPGTAGTIPPPPGWPWPIYGQPVRDWLWVQLLWLSAAAEEPGRCGSSIFKQVIAACSFFRQELGTKWSVVVPALKHRIALTFFYGVSSACGSGAGTRSAFGDTPAQVICPMLMGTVT